MLGCVVSSDHGGSGGGGYARMVNNPIPPQPSTYPLHKPTPPPLTHNRLIYNFFPLTHPHGSITTSSHSTFSTKPQPPFSSTYHAPITHPSFTSSSIPPNAPPSVIALLTKLHSANPSHPYSRPPKNNQHQHTRKKQ